MNGTMIRLARCVVTVLEYVVKFREDKDSLARYLMIVGTEQQANFILLDICTAADQFENIHTQAYSTLV